jgi:TPR repeat protein
MELIISIAIVIALFYFFGQMSLNKPIENWSDEELVRRLSKYEHLLSTQIKASAWAKTTETKAQIDKIRAEIIKRQKTFEAKKAAPLKQESLFGAKSDGVITEKAIAAADAGDNEMQVLVGTAYLAGANGLPHEPKKAATYLLNAAKGGNGFAAFIVAGLYADGLGVDQDFDLARHWAVKSKQLGVPDADQMISAIDVKRQGKH